MREGRGEEGEERRGGEGRGGEGRGEEGRGELILTITQRGSEKEKQDSIRRLERNVELNQTGDISSVLGQAEDENDAAGKFLALKPNHRKH